MRKRHANSMVDVRKILHKRYLFCSSMLKWLVFVPQVVNTLVKQATGDSNVGMCDKRNNFKLFSGHRERVVAG